MVKFRFCGMKTFHFKVVSMSNQLITGWACCRGTKLMITILYAKCSYLKRRGMWADLQNTAFLNYPWIVEGDFNCIGNDDECIGGQPRPLMAMEEFSKCIDSCGLDELKSDGSNMFWTNGHEGGSRKWANVTFMNSFGLGSLQYLARKTSDHKPMLLKFSKFY